MLEGLAAWVLNTYVGEYVENLNTDQLSIALLQGAVELDNLPLKKDALQSLGLPLQVKTGFIGKITLQIPLSRLHSEPWVISMERLYLVAGPLKDMQYDEAKEKAAEAARKAKLLQALEAKWQVQQKDKAESASWFSYGTSVLTNILENLQLKIKDVHLRYEDDVLNPACPFAFGVVIKELSAQSTDGAWVPKFVSRANCEEMHKLLDLKNFAIYFDTNTTLVGDLKKTDMRDSLQREMYVSNITGKFKEHEYILSPVTSTAKMKRLTTELPLRSQAIPRNTIDLTTEKMAFNLSEEQYRNMALLLKEFDKFERRKKFKKLRPSCSITESPKSWWKFAISVHLTRIQERNRRLTKNFLATRAQDIVKYTRTFKSELQKQYISAADKKHKLAVEEEWSFEEIKILREQVYKKIRKEGNVIKTPSPESSVAKATSPAAEDKGLLQRWFPGWGGWYGTQSSDVSAGRSDTVGEPPPPKISKSELEQELSEVIEEVTRDGEDDKSTLKKDAVFAKLNFTLDSGSFKLLGVKTEVQTGDRIPYSILELECTGISMMFESRPRTSGLKFGISVGGLVLLDKLTEDSMFPCLVGSQNKERFGALRETGTPGYQKAARILPLVEDSADNTLFELMYEKNPPSCTANRKFSVKTKPLDIVYNKAAFTKVQEIFSTKTLYASRKTELNIAASARRQYELLKKQTQQELRHTIDNLLEGTEGSQVKKWWVQLDISAPQIVVPESFQDPGTSMVMVDLGNLKFNNISNERTPDSQTNTEDDFHTPMSTPPSEAMEEETGEQTMNITDLSQMDLTESQFYNKLYDRYSLELTDLQVVVGKIKDNWRHIHHRGSTKLHLIDKFSITLQLERRLIYTTDPQWPSITVSGTLPQLTVHVNEHKVQTINRCLQKISQKSPTTQYPTTSPTMSLAESSGGLEELREATLTDSENEGQLGGERMDQEVIEDSQLLLMQFSINQLSLEIHSRERAVAELQVSGVRTNLTKRPYDTSVTLTVHSLLVVDALQTYGPDFELLVASHRNITIDSTSGSLRDSGPTSPQAMSPGSPPSSPIEQLPPTTVASSLQSVQDAVSRAFQALVAKGTGSPMPSPREHESRDTATSPAMDSEALIVVELEMISSKSPSNTNNEGPVTIANFQFNNLDIIANQETVVEILSFLKQVAPGSSKRSLQPVSTQRELSKSTADLFAFPSETENKLKFEVTADFNRLSLMFMRLDETSGIKTARKVSTATMSCARVQASVGTELTMHGSLGGFHVFDITPEVQKHQRVFSVGQDVPHTNIPRHVYSPRDMYKTAHESVLLDDLSCENKAFEFNLSKPLGSSGQYEDSYLNDTKTDEDKNCIKVSLQVASLLYTHSPRVLFEMSQCLTEFKEYALSVANSLKKAAADVAKGMVAKRSEMGYNSMYGSSSSLDTYSGSKIRFNQSACKSETEFLEGVATPSIEEPIKSKIVLDASLETPVIVIPKSATSSQVFVAHLGQISVSNAKVEGQGYETDDSVDEGGKSDRIFMEVRDMNLYSVNLDKDIYPSTSIVTPGGSLCNDVFVDKTGTPIMYNTTIQVTLDHTAPDIGVINPDNTQGMDFSVPRGMNDSFTLQEIQPLLDFNATIKTPVKLVLSKHVYEQMLQTVDNISYTEDVVTSNKNSNANVNEGETRDSSENSGSYYPSFKGVTGSQKFSTTSLSEAKKGPAFMSKHLKFEVPLFSVELRGDFGEGEQGLVELKLHRFLLDYSKDNPATTGIEVSLKSLVMDDLLEPVDSKHRQIMVSKAPKPHDLSDMEPHVFLSQSCPDNAIVAPIPMMPPSLPSSFHNDLSKVKVDPIQITSDIGFLPISSRNRKKVPRSKSTEYPCAPPSTPRVTRSNVHEELEEDNLVHISVLLVDKNSQEYVEKYNETKRFIDVDFSCLDTKINLQTWVILLDFLGLGAKVHDMETMQDPTAKPTQPDKSETDEYVQAVVNSEINLKVENLTIILNKPDYELAQASISKLTSHISLRDGNFDAKGQLGKMSLVDLSPHGTLYREKFLTVGEQAMEFDFFKYGIPDPWLKRDYDMRLKMTMASVRYTHTNRFHAELLGFVQHFLQLQEVLGRMRASSAGKNIHDAAFHSARILFDIEAGSPIILIPHSSRTTDVLVADLGTLSVKNCFRVDGDYGTFSEIKKSGDKSTQAKSEQSDNVFTKTNLSRTNSQMSQKTDGMASRSSSQSYIAGGRKISQGTDSLGTDLPHPLTQSIFDELQPPRVNVDLMTESIYGSLDHDLRDETSSIQSVSEIDGEIYDPTDKHGGSVPSEGSSVDPVSTRSRQNLLLDTSLDKNTAKLLHPPSSPALLRAVSTSSSETDTRESRNVFSNNKESLSETDLVTVDTTQHKCLLDILEVRMSEMDLFSAERVEKSNYVRKKLCQDLEFPSCVIQRRGGKLLKEKCMLNLNIERNLEGDISHSVPDWCVQGALSSVHCCLDIAQYKLIRGLLEHNLGEKFEIWKFKKELMTHMVDPHIQTVLTGDVYKVISMSVELTNVTLEFLESHEQGPQLQQVSIAKMDFIRSRLSYYSNSDQSKETDLVSHEILASDTRFKDVAVNLRPSVFERILEPSRNASPDSLQLELNFKVTKDGTIFKILLNNMKLMCSFDWLIRVNEFIMTKAENPFMTDGDIQQEGTSEYVVEPDVSTKDNGSRTASPLTTSGGIITKRGPQIDQTEVPFEFILNVTETQFVVVENLASLDTNAVILKCTAFLSYRPKAQDKLMGCNLQSLEVFSCSLLAEEDTAMSIVDPMTITIELNANPLPDLKTDKSAGLLDAKAVDQRELLLEVGFSTMNVRLSYLDMRMFLAIMNSLPKQALQAKQLKSINRTVDVPYSESQINQLQGLGFSTEDCQTALELTTGDTEAAAVWLTENAKIVPAKKEDVRITKVEVKANGVFVCLIDDCQDADVPLVELGFSGVNFNLRLDPSIEGKATFQIAADYYNRALSGWETLIELWRCHTDWKHFTEGKEKKEKKFAIQISAQDVLNINITRTLMDLYNSTKVKWTEDYYKEQEDSPQKEGVVSSAVRRREMFTPYKVRNQTGSPLWFLTVTMSPSSVSSSSFHRQKMDDAYIQATDWKHVPPNEEVPFAFYRREKIRHKKSQYLRVNQLVVKIDGWQRLSPVSVDKVGVYFRDTLPDITKHSIIKVNEGQPARVVFDVSQQGSALKVITLRSALTVRNQLDGPIDLRMENPIIPGRYEYMTIQTDQQKPVPMTFVNSKQWVKPSDWPVGFCKQPIEWKHVRKAGEVSNNVRACEMAGTADCFRYCVTIRREQYPHDNVKPSMYPLPGHTLLVMPTVTMVNLLPIEMTYYLKGTEITGTVKAGQEAQLHAADLDENIELGIHLENFPRCRELHIPPGTTNYKVKLRLYDNLDRLLELNVRILARYGAALRLSISAPHWLVNKSGLPLVFRQDDCSHESAGQFEEHELARSVTPLLFSFTEKELPYLCMMRLGKSVHGRAGLPQWCHSFSLDSGTGVRQLHVAPREGNRPDWVYNIGIEVKQGKGQFRNTNIVTFAPRYEIDNQSGHKLAIAQRHFTNKEAIRNPDGHLTALSKCKLPFHWPRQDLDQLLCVKLLDVPGCNWSGGFKIDKLSSFHINMRDDRRNSQLLKVDILLQGPTYHIIFTDSQEVPPPFMIDNNSEVPILYYQTKTHDERLRTTVKPCTSLSYAWDEPTLDPYMTLSVANGTTSTYNLNILGEAEQLTYQNFIYISATATFPRSGAPYSELQNKELVLDCQHENHVVFKKKEAGKRSQLWRMTSNGMLEHEGQAPPMDPRKPSSSSSRHRLVLDIADIALQPGRPIPLALKKADERRAAKQTWKFKDGMLCSSTGNFCVQALNGIEGFQDGAIAMLGPGPADPSDTSAIPLHMLTSSQKLHPGSGCLTVRVQMDGPVRVLQIADIRHRKVVRISSQDHEDWEIYEETFNHKTNEKRQTPPTKNMELSLNLKGGIGISLVNQIPEEILYISLKNITVFYLASKRAITMEMSVANIQADNQLFGTQRPIMLYVTPTSKKDVPDNTPALHIAAHKVPNANWNAEIFKHLIISMKKLTVQLEEKLLWKLVQFRGYSQSDPSIQKLEDNSSDLQKTLAAATSVKSKRYYFGQLKINSSLITLSMITTAQLSPELRQVKKTMSIPLIRFEDAKVDLDPFSRYHLFDTSTFLVEEITTHYKEELKSQAAKILGSVDFLGNPLGLFNDVTEGVKGLIEDGNVGGLVKNVAHGFSNSTAKVVGSLSDGIGKVHLDTKHNTKREQIRSTHRDSGSGQLLSGMKGLGHGMLGGFKSVLKPFEGARKGGAEGFVVGLYEGVTGIVTKPVVGILDFASGTANAIRDTSRRSSHMQPARVREPRCCHGPGGLLPVYSEKQAEAQSLLYMLNDQRYEEEFLIALETVRGGNGQSDSVYALITSIQVYFLHTLEPHHDSIILNVMHKVLAQCRSVENDGRHYIEMTRKDDSPSSSKSELKKPQIRCDKRRTAQKVAQQILYAKNLDDEQKQTLLALPNDEDD